jgi:hypothetical protein
MRAQRGNAIPDIFRLPDIDSAELQYRETHTPASIMEGRQAVFASSCRTCFRCRSSGYGISFFLRYPINRNCHPFIIKPYWFVSNLAAFPFQAA